MRKSEVLLNSLVYTAYFIASCICGVAVDFLVLSILDSIIVMSPFIVCVIRSVIYFIVPLSVIFVLGYKEGYKEAGFFLGETIFASAIATVIHFLFALLFAFNQFFAGGVRFVSAAIALGANMENLSQITEIRYRVFMPVFLAFAVMYCVALCLSKKLGCDARLADRKQLFKIRSK